MAIGNIGAGVASCLSTQSDVKIYWGIYKLHFISETIFFSLGSMSSFIGEAEIGLVNYLGKQTAPRYGQK
jgi:hypothetical protein